MPFQFVASYFLIVEEDKSFRCAQLSVQLSVRCRLSSGWQCLTELVPTLYITKGRGPVTQAHEQTIRNTAAAGDRRL